MIVTFDHFVSDEQIANALRWRGAGAVLQLVCSALSQLPDGMTLRDRPELPLHGFRIEVNASDGFGISHPLIQLRVVPSILAAKEITSELERRLHLSCQYIGYLIR